MLSVVSMQEPTMAATMKDMNAIVVSKETIKGAEEINQWRIDHGFEPLAVVVVDLVGDKGSSNAAKLSSTALREQEAAAKLRGS